MTFNSKQCTRREPLYDIDPRTGVSFEVFYSDRTLETFGTGGAGWFWWSRKRGFPPMGPAAGPFPTSYSAYRSAMNAAVPIVALTYNQRGAGLDVAPKILRSLLPSCFRALASWKHPF